MLSPWFKEENEIILDNNVVVKESEVPKEINLDGVPIEILIWVLLSIIACLIIMVRTRRKR
ncbi:MULTISPECIES: hypothetical protein [Bacillus cereus group]|uniref:Uncharacterized protein n=1 Tax=Bacillus thuringiensis TaxID=1428 RepID=A0A9X7ASM7_BACTU|nr:MULTISPECIES: hypothetical protein [Bacillus cereus group]PFT50893.1 hypothetical protein COK72_02470 [Bacillus thuringiensis]PFY22930.1 hypothetical protein COL44_18790 [Bacillus toyonensis]